MLKKFFLHLKTVLKHKWYVFKLAVRAGIPYRGLVHDMSKFSPEEFFEGVKYYQGNRSPIKKAREVQGYSKAWLHHFGRNKHHIEYWQDSKNKENILIPYKYAVEMICDHIAAGQVYEGKNWTNNQPIEYWNKIKECEKMYNPKTYKFITVIKEQIAKEGIKPIINKKHLKETYNKICK